MDGFGNVFGLESAHNQGQRTVGSHLDGTPVNSQDVFSVVSTDSLYFYNKFDILHEVFYSFRDEVQIGDEISRLSFP